MEKPRLYVAAAMSLLVYGLIFYLAFTGWRAHHEAVKLVAQAEQYRAKHHGALADCACDFGFDERHAFYERKSPTRYIVDYISPLGFNRYDSASGLWQTRYWFSGARLNQDSSQ